MKKKLTSLQMILIGLLCLFLQRVPAMLLGYTLGMALGVALNLCGLVFLVVGIVALVRSLFSKKDKPKE
jgi:hypothetical protein